MKTLAFIFHTSPHSTSSGREGLDALLAASAYTEDICVFFLGDGVTQLIAEQTPSEVLSRDYISAFKLMDLYDIERVYACKTSLEQFGLSNCERVIPVDVLSQSEIQTLLSQCDQILTF